MFLCKDHQLLKYDPAPLLLAPNQTASTDETSELEFVLADSQTLNALKKVG